MKYYIFTAQELHVGWNFPTGFLLEMTQWGKGHWALLFEGWELKGKNQKVQSVGCLCRRLMNMNEKVLKVCVVAFIYLTYFTDLPRASFFQKDSERMTNFVSVVQNWKIRSSWSTSLT